MTEQTPPDWTAWIVSTLLASVTAMVSTIVFLAKLIESKYLTEIRTLSTKVDLLEKKHEECIQGHHQADLKIARLEQQVANNTRDISHG